MPKVILDKGYLVVSIRYLLPRANGLLFYQRRIPPSLLSRYNGKTHILESLQTRDLSVARKRIAALAYRDNQLWADMRRDANLMSTAVDHEAKALVERWGLEVGKELEWYEDDWFDQMLGKYGDDFYDIQVGNHSPERRDKLIEELVTPGELAAFRLLKPQARTEPRLSDALAIYLDIHAKGHVDTKFTQLTTLAMNAAIDTLQNPTLASITRADARKVRDNIKGVTATVRRRLRVIVAVVNKAILELNLPITNPFKQLEIVDEGQDHEARKPFTADEHLTIAEACKHRDDEVRWLMATILDTGMRLKEAAGLRVVDVSLESPVPFVHIRPHKERALKTKGSQRIIPLVGLALWASQRAIEATTTPWVFPRYASATGIKSDSASGAINKWLQSLGVDNTSYGARHHLKDRMRLARIPEDVAKALMGHGTKTIADGYGKGYPLEVLLEAMDSVSLR